MSSNVFLEAFAVDFLVGKILTYKQNGDKTKIAARATEGIAAAQGALQVINGDPADGVNAIANAITAQASALDPDEALAIQNIVKGASQQLVILQAAKGTLLGQAADAIAINVINEVITACKAEGGTVPTTTSSPATPTATAAVTPTTAAPVQGK